MSDTPRTDSEEYEPLYVDDRGEYWPEFDYVPARFARELEREVNGFVTEILGERHADMEPSARVVLAMVELRQRAKR